MELYLIQIKLAVLNFIDTLTFELYTCILEHRKTLHDFAIHRNDLFFFCYVIFFLSSAKSLC